MNNVYKSFIVNIAGILIRIEHEFSYVKTLCEDYIVEDNDYAFEVRSSRDEIKEEIIDSGINNFALCESSVIYRKISLQMLNYNAFLLHGAVIEKDNFAYVFMAPSGTGKTTHINIWEKIYNDSIQVINGDKPIMRFFGDKLFACGSPWQGKEKMGNNIMCPVRAFAFIDRCNENSICEINKTEIMNRFIHQLLVPKEIKGLDKFFDLIDITISSYSFYSLKCNMENEAAIIAYNGMKGSAI